MCLLSVCFYVAISILIFECLFSFISQNIAENCFTPMIRHECEAIAFSGTSSAAGVQEILVIPGECSFGCHSRKDKFPTLGTWGLALECA